MWNILFQPQEIFCPIAKNILEQISLASSIRVGIQFHASQLSSFFFPFIVPCMVFIPLLYSLPHSFPLWQIKLRTLLENSHPVS